MVIRERASAQRFAVPPHDRLIDWFQDVACFSSILSLVPQQQGHTQTTTQPRGARRRETDGPADDESKRTSFALAVSRWVSLSGGGALVRAVEMESRVAVFLSKRFLCSRRGAIICCNINHTIGRSQSRDSHQPRQPYISGSGWQSHRLHPRSHIPRNTYIIIPLYIRHFLTRWAVCLLSVSGAAAVPLALLVTAYRLFSIFSSHFIDCCNV